MATTTILNLPYLEDGELTPATPWGEAMDKLDIANRTKVDIALVSGTYTLSGTQAQYARLNLTGSLTGDCNVVVPASPGWWLASNNTSGVHSATVKTGSGTGIAVAQGKTLLLFCDGVNVLQLDSTGGALLAANDLADLHDAATARDNLGLGDSATKDVGSGSSQVAAGNHTHGNATTGAAGFMSATDKTKLDGVTDDAATLNGHSDSEFVLLAGRAAVSPSTTGQTINGGTGSAQNLQLNSTSHSTKGFIYWGTTSCMDDAHDRIGILTTTPTYDLSFGGGSNRVIGLERSASGVGRFLTLQAGTGQSGQTDTAGGSLILCAGVSTGDTTTNSDIQFKTPDVAASSGSSDNLLVTRMRIMPGGNIRLGDSTIPTAGVHLAAGGSATNTAPLKFSSGSLLSTPEPGAMEYNGKFLLTESDNNARYIVQADSSTKTTGGVPYANDGYITVRINGTDVKVMTTAG